MSVVHLPLRLHPDCRSDAVASIEVALDESKAGELSLVYRVRGNIDGLALPAAAAPERTDGLWKHSCFEFFLGNARSSAYCEFNFSPSGQWAAYEFEGYRTGMSRVSIATPVISDRTAADVYELSVRLGPDLQGTEPRPIGLTAVIEEADGRLSYWALAHPPGKPDFHHRDCFAAELPAPSRS